MTINHKIDYKSYRKYSLLYEAVMGRTKDLNEVTKSLKCCWKAAKRHCKPCELQQGSLLCHQCCCFERPGSMWETEEDHSTKNDRQLCRIAKTNRFSWATQFSQLSQKWSCVLGREVSTAGRWLPFVVYGRWASVAANLQQNPCLTASRS